MKLKRIGSAVVVLALSLSCMSFPIANAMQWKDGMTPHDIISAKFEALATAEKQQMTAAEKDAFVDKLLEAFESGDFTELSFYERTAVFDDGLFDTMLEESGLSRRQKNKLLKARTGAFDTIEIERDVDYYDWLDSREFAAFLDTTNLTDEQKAGLLASRPVFNDSTMLDAYLRQLGLSETERKAFRDDLHKAYEDVRYSGLAEPVGYDAENFQFEAFVDMLESGEFDKLLAKRDKNKKFSDSDKLVLAKKFDAFFDIDESDIYAGMRARFTELSEAE